MSGPAWELIVDGRAAGRVADPARFEPPARGRWALRPEATLRTAEATARVVQVARGVGLTRLALRLAGPDAGPVLAALPPLRALTLEGEGVTDAALAALAGQVHLEELELIEPSATGLAALKGLSALRALRVLRAPLVPGALGALPPLTRLELLHLPGCPLDAEGAAPLAALRSLRELDLSGAVGLDDAGLAPLAALRGLEALRLAGCEGVEGPGLAALSGLTRLRRLDLSGTSLHHRALEHLRPLAALEQLSLAQVPLWEVEDLRARLAAWPRGLAAAFPRVPAPAWRSAGPPEATDTLAALAAEDLVEVELPLSPRERGRRLARLAAEEGVDLSVWLPPMPGLAVPGALPALRDLDLGEAGVPEGAQGCLVGPALRRLGLAGAHLRSARGLGPGRGLRALDLSGCPGGAALLPDPREQPELASLRLAGGRLTAEDLAGLQGFTALAALSLQEVQLAPGALAPLAALPRLRVLGLRGATLDRAGLAALADAPALTALDLGRATLSPEDLDAVGGLLGLAHLDLSHVPVDDARLLPLGRSTTLTWLGLAFTLLSPEGLARLSAALPRAVIQRSLLPGP